MSRSGGEGGRPSGAGVRRGAFAALALALAAAPAWPQVEPQPLTGIELTRPVNQALLQLQEDWLQWMSAFYQNNPQGAQQQVADLRATLEVVGMSRLPDLSVAATVRAVESARQGNFERAAWGLAAADALDPGRPDVDFGRAILAWERGSYVQAGWYHLVGYARLLAQPEHRRLWLANAVLGALAVGLLAGAGFVVVQLAAKGGQLYRGFAAAFGRRLPAPVGHLLALLVLLWPLAVPDGLVWALLYWSVLLWGYASVSERVVLALVWVAAGAAPWVVSTQQQQMAITLSPAGRALEALESGRLYGGLFSDLGVLRTLLPNSSTVRELVGDVHRRLGQWEEARARYAKVVEAEPENVTALINLGAYYFRKGDFGNAVQLFQRAAAADPASAAAYYNLSQAYSESYLFNEQRRALWQARAVGEARVSHWIQNPRADRVVTFDGGIARGRQIRRELALSWRKEQSDEPDLRRHAPLALPVVALLLALAFQRLRPISPGGDAALGAVERTGPLARLARVALPGLAAAEEGKGGRAYGALLVLAALVLVLAPDRLGYSLPLGFDPGDAVPVAVAVAGLVAFFAARLWWDVKRYL